jgi:hypothetical protein
VAAREHRVAARRSGRQVGGGASSECPAARPARTGRGEGRDRGAENSESHGGQLASGRAPGADCGRY